MFARIKRGFLLLFGCSLIIAWSCTASAEDRTGIQSGVALSSGWEYLRYEEHESDTDLKSKGEIHNWVFGFDGVYRTDFLFSGVKGIVHVGAGKDRETWEVSGSEVQENDLMYRWYRIDGYFGYPLVSWINPYGGARWSYAEQERDDFEASGVALDLESTEIVRAWSALFGLRGVGTISRKLKWHYSAEYHIPVFARVTNDAVDDFEVDDHDGYSWEINGGAEYFLRKNGSIGLSFTGGRMHWEGSDWERVNGVFVKWPENDTMYYLTMIIFRATY